MLHRPKRFDVLFTDDEVEKLDELANITHRSKGAAIREAVRIAYRCHVEGKSLCASGVRCIYQMHEPEPPA